MVLLALLACFIRKYALHYFAFTPESCTPYFWPKVSWLFPHVAAGLLAILIGPVQFWSRMRANYLPPSRSRDR